MKNVPYGFILSIGCLLGIFISQQAASDDRIFLRENWSIQSSQKLRDNGSVISKTGYQTEGWYGTTIPKTVLAALVENKIYPDPYYGTNIESIPGYTKQRRGEMPEESPFRVPWWYRTEFSLPSEFNHKNILLYLHSINYKANIWLNGKLIADTTQIEGAYRLYDLNLTGYAEPGKQNCLALEIFPPKGMDLTITWVDWNPTPPDRGMGIWYDVTLRAIGDVMIRDPHVITKLNLPLNDEANLTVGAELENLSKNTVSGTLTGKIENIEFSLGVTLNPGEKKQIDFLPGNFPQLKIKNPRLWWPYTIGQPNLYDLDLKLVSDQKISDSKKIRFGIREITSYMNSFGNQRTRVFQVNGKNMVIRGGGYVEDMMLRPSNERIDTELKYLKQMNLNALRMEAPRGPDYIYEKCDEEGILVMVGWCCCSSWERWKRWTPHTADIAEASWRDLIVRLRNHPSVFDWLYGSDNFPPVDIEQRYINVLNKYDGTRPYQSSATQDSSTIAGYTGLWMGPYPSVYAYEPPSSWYNKLQFNTEAGPGGEQISPYESLKKMMPEKDLWPISESWNIRYRKQFDSTARAAMYQRYGEPKGVAEYCTKSQVFQLEMVRAMFEAFARNKYQSSGIIYWMFNSAWPNLYWDLFDYFFTPNGSFYGARKACEPLHVQFAYDDSAVYVVNGLYKKFDNLKVRARLFDFNLTEKFTELKRVDLLADESKKVILIQWPKGVGNIYFLKLELMNDRDSVISDNFYWLSKKGDQDADYTELNKLAAASLKTTVISSGKNNDSYEVTINIENPSPVMAFAVNPKIKKSRSKDLVLPVFWEDNYFTLMPNEKKTLKVKFNPKDLGEEKPILELEAWNVKAVEVMIP
jgi:exo-1,4-beta-D-glucosaminidase